MKIVEIEVKIGILKKELAYWEDLARDRRCIKCDNFNGVCKIAGVRPPDDVMLSGCPEWTYDEIPF